MPNTSDSDKQTTTNRDPNDAMKRSYYVWAFDQALDLNSLAELTPQQLSGIFKDCHNHAFRAGAIYNFKLTSLLSPHLAKFLEYLSWLDVLSKGPNDSPNPPTNDQKMHDYEHLSVEEYAKKYHSDQLTDS